MNRRKFLAASLGATAGGILVAADVLSTKTFFLPPAGGWRQDRDILYGYPVRPYAIGGMSDGSRLKVSMSAPPGLMNLNDVVAVNGRPHRVTALEYATGAFGREVLRLDLVRIETGVRLIS